MIVKFEDLPQIYIDRSKNEVYFSMICSSPCEECDGRSFRLSFDEKNFRCLLERMKNSLDIYDNVIKKSIEENKKNESEKEGLSRPAEIND